MKFVKKLTPLTYITYACIILGGIILDQLTKLIAVLHLEPVGSVTLIKGLFSLTYVENRGAAWGMFADRRWVFMVISTVALLALCLYLFAGRAQTRLYAASIAIIISGGIGNMIDRIALGYVVDFLHFTLIDFPVFNVADSLVCIGAGMLILALILEIIKEFKEKKKDGAND